MQARSEWLLASGSEQCFTFRIYRVFHEASIIAASRRTVQRIQEQSRKQGGGGRSSWSQYIISPHSSFLNFELVANV